MNGPPVDPPLSYTQQLYWLLDRYHVPGTAAGFIVSSPLLLQGPLDRPALDRALRAFVERHEPAQTTLVLVDGQPRQRVGPVPTAVIAAEQDLRDRPDRDEIVHQRVVAHHDEHVDLAVGPALRAELLRLGAEEHLLLLTAPHAFTDLVSVRILYDELRALYASFAAGREPALPVLKSRYAEQAIREREKARSGGFERQRAFWTQQLAGSLLLPLKTDRPVPPKHSGKVTHFESVELPEGCTQGMVARSQKSRVTPAGIVLSAIASCLARESACDDLTLGVLSANRQTADAAATYGSFAQWLPLRLRGVRAGTGLDLLARTRAALWEGLENECPYQEIVAATGRELLFNVAFSDASSSASLGPEPRQPASVELGIAPGQGLVVCRGDFGPLSARLAVQPNRGYRGADLAFFYVAHRWLALGYNPDLFEAASARRWLERTLEELARLISGAEQALT